MQEEHANIIAEILGDDLWQSGGGIHVVIIRRSDGRLIVFSDEAICEYRSQEALEESRPINAIRLR